MSAPDETTESGDPRDWRGEEEPHWETLRSYSMELVRVPPGERARLRVVLHHKEGAIVRTLRTVEFRGWDILHIRTESLTEDDLRRLHPQEHPQDISDKYSAHLAMDLEIGPRLRPRSPETLGRHLTRILDIIDVQLPET